MRIRDVALVPLVAIAGFGCAKTTAPPGWLPTVNEAMRDPYGGWVTVYVWSDSTTRQLDGELIAVEEDSLYVLTEARLSAVAQRHVLGATLNRHASASGPMALWTTLGSLSTISHGVGLIFSFPTWLIVGSLTTADVSKQPLMRYPGVPLASFRPFARFPAGCPPGELQLQPKWWSPDPVGMRGTDRGTPGQPRPGG